MNSMYGFDLVVAITHYVGQLVSISIVLFGLRGHQEPLSLPLAVRTRSPRFLQSILFVILVTLVIGSEMCLTVAHRLDYFSWAEK